MKVILNVLRWAALAGVAALAVFSCNRSKEEEAVPAKAPALRRTIVFHASELSTKAQFGTPDNGVYPTLWTSNDTEAKISLNLGSAIAADVTPAQDGKSSTLSAEVNFQGVTGPFTFYAVSPSSAAMSLSPSRSSWKVSIPCEQTPTSGSVDENAIILAASSIPYETSAQIADVDLYFSHLTAYGRVTLTNPDQIPSGASIQAVELTATTPLVGDWFWACEASNEGVHTLLDYGASSTITLNTSSVENVWFACAPVDLSDEIMTVRVITDKGVLEKDIWFDGTDFQLQAGATAVFSVNMSEAAGAEFTASGSSGGGNDVVVLSEEFDNSTTSDSSTEFSSSKFPNFSGPTSKAYTSQYGGVKLGSSSASGYITSKSLDLSNGFTVTLNVLKYGSDTGKVQVTVGDVTKEITPTATDTAYSLDFDAATSASTVKIGTSTKRAYIDNVIITRHDGGSGSGSSADPLLSETEYGCYLGTGLEWTLNAGTDQVTRSYDANNVLTYTLIKQSTVEELEIIGYTKAKLKGDSVTVSVNWRRGTATVHSGTYNMTLVMEAGPKVWLSDGNGKGFIIKK